MVRAVGEAGRTRSARFPSISLTAGGGAASGSIKGLTSGDPWVWNAAGALVEPLVAFGKLRRAEQAAVAAYDQAARNYEQTVLTAFADVEKALTAITTCREQTERSRELVESNGRIATMTRALYRSGLSDYLDVIDAERSLYQSQMQLASLVAQQYINYVALCKALGGGWERPSGPPAFVTGGAPPGRKPEEPPRRPAPESGSPDTRQEPNIPTNGGLRVLPQNRIFAAEIISGNMRLSELKTGESATIVKVTGHGGFRRRIMEMGFVRGQRVEVILERAP